MTSITIDQSICRNRTTITAVVNGDGKIDTSVTTLCAEVEKRMHLIPQSLDPQTVLAIRQDILPECFLTCATVTGAGCPFICVTYQAIASEAAQAADQTDKESASAPNLDRKAQ